MKKENEQSLAVILMATPCTLQTFSVWYAGSKQLSLSDRLAKLKNTVSVPILLAWMLSENPFIVSNPDRRKTKRLQESLFAVGIVSTVENISTIGLMLDKTNFWGFRGYKAIFYDNQIFDFK